MTNQTELAVTYWDTLCIVMILAATLWALLAGIRATRKLTTTKTMPEDFAPVVLRSVIPSIMVPLAVTAVLFFGFATYVISDSQAEYFYQGQAVSRGLLVGAVPLLIWLMVFGMIWSERSLPTTAIPTDRKATSA